MLISQISTCFEKAAPLNVLIFDVVYGSWILFLLLFTLGNTVSDTLPHYIYYELLLTGGLIQR